MKSQKGFAVGPVLVVVALIAIIGAAFTVSNRGTSTNSAAEVARVNSGLIAQQAIALKSSIERYIVEGVAFSNLELTITPSGAGKVPLFDPVKGYGVQQTPPKSAGTGTWSIAAYTIPGVGINANPDDVVALGGIAKETCQRLLKSLHNIDQATSPVLFGTIATNVITAGTGTPNATGMHEGCVATSATPAQNDYVYYSVAKAN